MRRRRKNVVPYGTHHTSVFDKGQQSFVRLLLYFHWICVVPIITYWYSLDDADYLEYLLILFIRKFVDISKNNLLQSFNYISETLFFSNRLQPTPTGILCNLKAFNDRLWENCYCRFFITIF